MGSEQSHHCILYLDDSGDIRWPGTGTATEHFVLAGVILHGPSSAQARAGIRNLIRKHDITTDWGQYVSALHCVDLVHKKGDYTGWSDEKCRAVHSDVWSVVEGVNAELMGTVVKKRRLRHRYTNPDTPLFYAMRATIGRFDMHLEATRGFGHVVMDTLSKSVTQDLHAAILRWRETGTGYGSRTPPDRNRRLSRVLDTVFVVPDNSSPGLQLADWVAYSTLAKWERGYRGGLEKLDQMWRRVSGFQEPSVIPSW